MTADAGARQESARGARRRALLLDAAADLLREHGFARLSHRAVAERAQVPLGATTYYFSSREDLLRQAFERLAARWLDRATAFVRSQPAELDRAGAAAAVVAVVTATATGPTGAVSPPGSGSLDGAGSGGTDDLLAMYERYLEAGRHSGLRVIVGAYDSRLADLVDDVVRRAGPVPDPLPTRLLLAVVDGTILSALAHGTPAAEAAETAARHVLMLLPPGPSVRAAPAGLT